MAELIDRTALIDRLKSEQATSDTTTDYDIGYWNGLTMAQSMTRNAPTITPDDLRSRGMWIPSESDFDDDDTLFDVEEWCDWQCTACHEDICYEDPMERRWLPKFCPNCGARMEEEK